MCPGARLLCLVSSVLVACPVLAGPPPRIAAAAARVVSATPVAGAAAVKLDGDLNDASWRQAPVIDAFVQREPDEGKPPSFRTEARVLYDSTALYIAVRAFDPEPSKIVGHLTRRDTDSPSDWISVIVDSYHDRRTAYEFDVNAAGVKMDAYRFADTSSDTGWDAVWDVKVAVDAQGWVAQFRIPLSQLRFDPAHADTFGLAIVRRVGRLNETSTWPFMPRGASGIVSILGELTNLRLGGSQKRFELTPYGVGQLRTQPPEAGNPFIRHADPGGAVGADMKFAVTPALMLTGTINPDFGQVEADPAVVNLTGFETYFAEQRPFFMEGSGTFRFDIDCNNGQCYGLFYSRRVGRAPHAVPDTPTNGFVSAPPQTTILGASKLTGRVGSFSIGVLNAITGEEQGQIFDGTTTTTQAVEPFTSYSVARAKREFAGQSSLGFMVTATNRRLTADVSSVLPGSAYTGGVDWDWRTGKGLYSLTGNWAFSSVRGSAASIDALQEDMVHAFQRPDSRHLREDPSRTSLNGMEGQLSVSKIGGDRVRFSAVSWFKTPGFEINDVGFLRRADEYGESGWLQLRRDTPSRHLRTLRVNFNGWAIYNFDGDLTAIGGNVNGNLRTKGNHTAYAGISLDGAGFDDRMTRGGPGGMTTRWLTAWAGVATDDRKPVQVSWDAQASRNAHGSSRVFAGPGLCLRPSSAVSVTAGVNATWNTDDAQWVDEVTDTSNHYVFGHLRQTTVSSTLRVNYTLTPQLSIQMYAQPFVSAGAYTRFRELVNGRAAAYADRFAEFHYTDDPDFNYKSLRATNVLRWEYLPGSTLFLVWQQGRENTVTDGSFRLGRDVRGVFDIPSRNVFMIKIAHWFNF